MAKTGRIGNRFGSFFPLLSRKHVMLAGRQFLVHFQVLQDLNQVAELAVDFLRSRVGFAEEHGSLYFRVFDGGGFLGHVVADP